MKQNDIFISYRREGGDMTAMYIYQALKDRGYRVFYDVEVLRAGKFNEELLKEIQACTDFILVLSPHALDRCTDDDDWVRQEIAEAIRCEKNIIPVMLNGFSFPDTLPADINAIRFRTGLTSTTEYFQESMDRLCEKFLKSQPVKKKWIIPAAAAVCVVVLAAIFLLRPASSPMPEPSPVSSPVPASTEEKAAESETEENGGFDAAHTIQVSLPVLPEAMEEISIMSDDWLFAMPFEGNWTLEYVDGVDLNARIENGQFFIDRFPRQEGTTEYKATRFETDYQILLEAEKPAMLPEDAVLVGTDGEDLNEKELTVKVGEEISVICHFVPENWTFRGQEQKSEIWMEDGDRDALEYECEGTSGKMRIMMPGQYKIGVKVNSGAAVAYRFLYLNVTE